MKKRLLAICQVWPESKTTAAGVRMLQLFKMFLQQHWTVVAASSAMPNDYSDDLEHMGIRTHQIQVNDPEFEKQVSPINPDLVLFDRFISEEQFSWKIHELFPQALKLLDTEDLHFLRAARRQAHAAGQEDFRAFLPSSMFKREMASILRSDLSLIISKFEFDLLLDEFGLSAKILHHLPFLLDSDKSLSAREASAEGQSFAQRKDLMVLGNFKHAPNRDALVYLKQEIWPKIRKRLPGVKLNVYGAYGDDFAVRNKDEKNGFFLRGWIEDAESAMGEHRLLLAPLRYGAGLKGKLFQAMCQGLPSITSSVGAEGFGIDKVDWPGNVSDQADVFVQNVVDLYQNEELWQKASRKGPKTAGELFDQNKHLPALFDRINQLLENLAQHRRSNHLYQILWHQSLRSHAFMGKWIEAKNQKPEAN